MKVRYIGIDYRCGRAVERNASLGVGGRGAVYVATIYDEVVGNEAWTILMVAPVPEHDQIIDRGHILGEGQLNPDQPEVMSTRFGGEHGSSIGSNQFRHRGRLRWLYACSCGQRGVRPRSSYDHPILFVSPVYVREPE